MHMSSSFSLFFSLLIVKFAKSNEEYLPPGYVAGKTCFRKCNENNLKCYFDFTLETIYTSNRTCSSPDCIIVDGAPRAVNVVNRQLPGPSIEVCKGDTVTVLIRNKLRDGQSTAIHFHGYIIFGIDAYSDGAPYVTQCPISYNNNFTYSFVAHYPGTYWYHSHDKLQYGYGLFGAFIVREIFTNFHGVWYNTDWKKHVMLVGHWSNRSDHFLGNSLRGDLMEPTGILINGKGYHLLNDSITNTPLANFLVHKGSRHRFRLINVGFLACPLELSIDGHPIRIIAIDGNYIASVFVDSFILNAGERFDIVVNANNTVGTYWIRIKGHIACRNSGLYTVATFQYRGSTDLIPLTPLPTYENAAPTESIIMNPITGKAAEESGFYTRIFTTTNVYTKFYIPGRYREKPDYQYYITLGVSPLYNPDLHGTNKNIRVVTPQLNHISYRALDRPLLPNRNEINCDEFCDESTLSERDCLNNLCQCVHLIHVSLNSLVEFIFINEWTQNEAPQLIHLHGYKSILIGWDEVGRNFTKDIAISMDKNSSLSRSFKHTPYKDTVLVPKGGYIITRLVADNPGYWLMECYNGYVGIESMSLIFKVGDDKDMVDAPANFPNCGNWNPEWKS